MTARGEQNHQAKLTWEKVREIRRRAATGAVYYDLAKEYGVHYSTIKLVVYGQTWKEGGSP